MPQNQACADKANCEKNRVRSPMFDGTMIDYCAACLRVLNPKAENVK